MSSSSPFRPLRAFAEADQPSGPGFVPRTRSRHRPGNQLRCRVASWRLIVRRLHYGWIMLFAVALMAFASAGSRFSFGVFVRPMSEELHWGRDQLALAASLNLLLAGLLRPLVGVLADRLGSRL